MLTELLGISNIYPDKHFHLIIVGYQQLCISSFSPAFAFEFESRNKLINLLQISLLMTEGNFTRTQPDQNNFITTFLILMTIFKAQNDKALKTLDVLAYTSQYPIIRCIWSSSWISDQSPTVLAQIKKTRRGSKYIPYHYPKSIQYSLSS